MTLVSVVFVLVGLFCLAVVDLVFVILSFSENIQCRSEKRSSSSCRSKSCLSS
jgi:hypothetical protein